MSRNLLPAASASAGLVAPASLARTSSTLVTSAPVTHHSSGELRAKSNDCLTHFAGRFKVVENLEDVVEKKAIASDITQVPAAENLVQEKNLEDLEQIERAVDELWQTCPHPPDRAAGFKAITAALTERMHEITSIPPDSRFQKSLRYCWIAYRLPTDCKDAVIAKLIDLLPAIPPRDREALYFKTLLPKSRLVATGSDAVLAKMLQGVEHLAPENRGRAWDELYRRLTTTQATRFAPAKIALIEAADSLPAPLPWNKFILLNGFIADLPLSDQPAAILAMNRLVETLPEANQRAEGVAQVYLLVRAFIETSPLEKVDEVVHTLIRHASGEFDRLQAHEINTTLRNGARGPKVMTAFKPHPPAQLGISLVKSLQILMHASRKNGDVHAVSMMIAIIDQMQLLLQKGILKQLVVQISRELSTTPPAVQTTVWHALKDKLESLQSDLQKEIALDRSDNHLAHAYATLTDVMTLVPKWVKDAPHIAHGTTDAASSRCSQ
ncbi:MAG: hypothetical protein V4695_09555 [Pseudomonadota bacterium]